MYQLPGYLLELLGERQGGALQVALHPRLRGVRPLEGLTVSLSEGQAPLLCKPRAEEQDSHCGAILESMAHLTRLRDDLFTGRQYGLSPLSR